MKRELSLICGMAMSLAFFGCSKSDHPKDEVSATTTTNTNSLVFSTDSLQRQINATGTHFTNALGDIREAAGAAASNTRTLTDRLRSALQADPAISGNWQTIRLSAENGKIILNGTVKSEADRQVIVTKARGIVGAERLEDRLQVKPAGAAIPEQSSSNVQPVKK